jgi:hypothetical protein
MNIDLTAFSHSQTMSKLWLCETIESYLPKNATVFILGSWYNTLGSMMLIRNRRLYNNIQGIDIDQVAVQTADKLCEAWIIERKLSNFASDVSTCNLQGPDVIINCSVEHMANREWFNNITKGTLVCLQSSDVNDSNDPWFIKQPSPTMSAFLSGYPFSKILFTGTKKFDYASITFNRFMVIGIA